MNNQQGGNGQKRVFELWSELQGEVTHSVVGRFDGYGLRGLALLAHAVLIGWLAHLSPEEIPVLVVYWVLGAVALVLLPQRSKEDAEKQEAVSDSEIDSEDGGAAHQAA